MIRILRNEITEIDTSRKALRSFGILVGGLLLGLALIMLWRKDWVPESAHQIMIAAGCLLVLFGVTIPQLLKPAYVVWMALAVILGFVMTRVVLTIVYYLVVTPTGAVMHLMGRDPLDRTIDREASTYWLEKSYPDDSPKRLEKYY